MSAEKFKETVTLPIAIPTAWLVTILASGIFSAGIIYNKIDSLAQSYNRIETRLSAIQDKQLSDSITIGGIQENVHNHENRLTNVERTIFDHK